MKCFDIVEKAGMVYGWDCLHTAEGFKKILNCEEKRRILEEQLRDSGLQPIVLNDNSGVEIITASKKFMSRDRRYNQPMSKRAQEYINFCKESDE